MDKRPEVNTVLITKKVEPILIKINLEPKPKNPKSSQYMKNPSEILQLIAVVLKPEAIYKIDQPTEKALLLTFDKKNQT